MQCTVLHTIKHALLSRATKLTKPTIHGSNMVQTGVNCNWDLKVGYKFGFGQGGVSRWSRMNEGVNRASQLLRIVNDPVRST